MIHHGDCIEVMAGMDPESVDAIVTDPPYGLEFMGKEWDKFDGGQQARWEGRKAVDRPDEAGMGADELGERLRARPGYGGDSRGQRCLVCRHYKFSGTPCRCEKPVWEIRTGTPPNAAAFQKFSQRWATEAMRVAKPSAYLLAFGGTRTVHRMTVALEDAGWIIRDMLVWAYACLSDDTELLTAEGWVPYNKANVGQLAAAFDPDNGELRWSPIEAVHVYHHEGDMAEVGPSLVTLNHRVVIDEATARVPRVPGLRDGVREAVGVGQEGEGVVLLESVQRHATGVRSAEGSRNVVAGATATALRTDARIREPRLEGRRYRVQEARELFGSPLRAEPGVGATDGPQGRLRHGASADRGRPDGLPADQDRVREPREPRPDRQPTGQPDPLAGQPDAQALRMGQVPDRDSEPDTVRLVPYAGTVWCITVPTGAFVARRNGVVFVTGNSGFPKSKASLKPAWEPIVMARKPGPLRMLNIDECRIPSVEDQSRVPSLVRDTPTGMGKGLEMGGAGSPLGRWPANVILTDPIFDGGVEGVVGGGETATHPGTMRADAAGNNWFGPDRKSGTLLSSGDSGTYSRFFLIPKADRADREPVLGGLPLRKPPGWSSGEQSPGTFQSQPTPPRQNVHPTVKPTDLMRHLVRLVTPTGGTVLDPFLGSGTTGLAAEMEGFDWIGIEREAEYVAIAEARLNGTQRGLGLEAS